MENVPGILTIENGKVRDLMIREFEKMGYKTSVRILEAAEFNVPQFRTRAIFIGNRINKKNPYPKPILNKDNFLKIEDFLRDLENHPRDPSINHEWTNHSKQFEERISKVKPGQSLYEKFKDAYKRQYLGVPSMTIKENHGGTHIHPKLNRVISVREMARLQTFPDNFFFEGTMKRGMWQVGNAVPVNLAKHIGLSINSYL
jgi:DNA (cytosine-5)-methyltransferase 1